MRALLITFVSLALLGAPVAGAAGPETLVAHRGLSGSGSLKYEIPENSIPAWQWAVQHEADIVDLDVQLTSNGTMVIMHDSTLNRTTNGSGAVRDRSWSYIRGLWLEIEGIDRDGNGNPDNTPYHPPSLEAALRYLAPIVKDPGSKTQRIALEMKGSGWTQTRVNALAAKLKTHGLLTGDVCVHAFSATPLSYAKKAGIPSRGYAVGSSSSVPSPSTVKAYGNNVFLNYAKATPANVRAFYNAGIRTWLWTMDTYAEYDRALQVGPVYAWVVDDLPEAQRYLEEAN